MAAFRRVAPLVLLALGGVVASFNGASGAPSLAPGPLDARGFRVKLIHAESGSPVRFNPCAPLHYVINPALAPPGAAEDVHTAIQMTSEAAGLRFVYDGETDEVPVANRPTYQRDRYGDRWAPILISWANGLHSADPDAGEEGGRPIAVAWSDAEVNDDGQAVYVTGAAVFDASVTDLPKGFGGQTWGQAMLHEMGHVVGLDHVDAPDSVMNPVIGLRPAAWATEDRAGLWALGIGSTCVSPPSTP